MSVNEGSKYNFGEVKVVSKLEKMNIELLESSLPFNSGTSMMPLK